MNQFEPVIVAFCCHYCAYTAADMAGSQRLNYPPNDCHFKNGNTRVARRVVYIKQLLDEIGINGERLEMFYMSAGMGERFSQIARDMTQKIRDLGPNPAKQASTIEAEKSVA